MPRGLARRNTEQEHYSALLLRIESKNLRQEKSKPAATWTPQLHQANRHCHECLSFPSRVGLVNGGKGDAFIEVGQDDGPSLVMAEAGGFVGEARVGQVEVGTGVERGEFDGDYRFGTMGGDGQPGELDQAVGIEEEKAAVVGVTLAFVLGLEEEGRVGLRIHEDSAWDGEPAVEFFGPGEVEGGGRGEHVALGGDVERSCREIGWGDDCGHGELPAEHLFRLSHSAYRTSANIRVMRVA